MKLLRYGLAGSEKPGILDADGNVRSLGGVIDDLYAEGIEALKGIDVSALPVVNEVGRIGPCIAGVGKFICIGLNYEDHAAESGMELPPEPVIFMKATSAICGPNDDVIKPKGSTKMDWEVELGVIVGKELRYASEEEAANAIAGYCVINDLSERAFQLEMSGQWVKGKSNDTFGPIGPYLVTPEEIDDPLNLDMWLEVNGHRYQDGNTKTMVYKPAFTLSYLSRFMSLQPGDVVSTGTPPGVGLGQTPPTYLNVGDVMELGIEGLGSQRQTVVAAE